jgi:uncharacterized metal-binding protein YceD (DUF177 family)
LNDRFAHAIRVDQIRDGQRIDLAADDSERRAIVERLDLDGLDRLAAHVTLSRDSDSIKAEGRLSASLTQRCVITGDPVASHVDEPFTLIFKPEPSAFAPDEEIELASDELDTIFYEGGVIDLGSAIADTLALGIDPFPRSAGAEAALKEAGVMSEAEASPFAVLAKLKGNDES